MSEAGNREKGRAYLRDQAAKVGVFRDIDYADYPWPSQRSRGGKMGE